MAVGERDLFGIASDAGVSIWLDTLSRQLLESGAFAELIRDYSVTGATSNPTIFAKAITGSDLYDRQLRRLADAGKRDPQELFFSLALEDVREAAGLLRAEYDRSEGCDGFISFECTPRSRRRHPSHDRAGERAVGAARPAERDDQGPRDPPRAYRRSRSSPAWGSTSTSRCCSRSSATRR